LSSSTTRNKKTKTGERPREQRGGMIVAVRKCSNGTDPSPFFVTNRACRSFAYKLASIYAKLSSGVDFFGLCASRVPKEKNPSKGIIIAISAI
jgi:hypothetical protein